MDILSFLNTLENTLCNLEVRGRDNIDRLMGCFIAIDNMKQAILKDGEENGRQSDIGTLPSNEHNAE